MREIVERVKARTSIPVYERTIGNVLSAIQASSDVWRIVDLSEEPLPLVVAVLEALHELGHIAFEGPNVILTESGKQLVEKYGIGPRRDYT
ncbi:MAG: N(4)-bis(aminopropyl)spermidine synthase, partial [Thermococcus sp.]